MRVRDSLIPTWNEVTQPPAKDIAPHILSYQNEEEYERAEGAEDDVDGDEDGEVVELGALLLGVALRILFLPADSEVVDEYQVRLIHRGSLSKVVA